MRCILVFIAHFPPLELSRCHWLVPVHGLLNQISGHCAVLDLVADFLPCIFKLQFDFSSHVFSLTRFQILTIIIVLSPYNVLHELNGFLSLLLICVFIQFCQAVNNLALLLVAPKHRKIYALLMIRSLRVCLSIANIVG